MRPTLWELDSQTEKGGNLFISVKELNHLVAILHVYAGGLNFMK